MRRSSALAAALLATGSWITLASPAGATWSTSPYSWTPICTAAGDQAQPVLATDGAGGAYLAWYDARGNYGVYATRVTHDGLIAPGWPLNGLAVCSVSGFKYDVQLVPGASGDVYVVWGDSRAGNEDVYVQRLLGNGTVAPGWPANGLAITNDVRDQILPRAASDGAGGVYLVWTLEYSQTDEDVYAARVLPSSAFAGGFAINGIAINAAVYRQNQPAITADGAGNAIIVYANEDVNAVSSTWGQKLTPSGACVWGSPYSGVRISVIGNDQRSPLVVSDGAGGAIMVDVFAMSQEYAVSFDGSGLFRDQWEESLTGGPLYTGSLIADGAGGAWVSWKANQSFP